MSFPFNESLITVRRKGDSTDPFISLVRNIMVKGGKVQLPEIPSQKDKVVVTGNSQTWYEISSGTPTGTNYKVSYLHGYVEFDPINDGKTLTFTMMGTGNVFLSSERVWTISDGTTVTQTLKDKLSAMDTKDTSLQTQITDNELDIENKIAAHKTSSDHPAQNITYSGTVPSQTHVKGAIDATYSRIDNIIAGAPSSAAEVIDGRTLSDNVARVSLGVAIREIHAKQLAAVNSPVTIKRGLNSVNAPEGGKLDVKIKGKTLTNITGKDGNCESLTPFTLVGTVALSTTQKKSGTNSIKTTSSGADSYFYKDYTYPLDSAKQYFVGFWVYIESWSAGVIEVTIRDVGALTTRYTASANTSTIGSWQFAYVKIPTSNTLVGTGFRVLVGAVGTPTAVAYFDDIRLYELSTSDYNAIGTTYTATTTPSIDDFIPYVDSMKPLTTPYIEKKGKNLIPPFTEWTLHANAVATEPYKLTLNATAAWQNNEILKFSILPSQQYTISANFKGRLILSCIDANGNSITPYTADITNNTLSQASQTFTIPSNAVSATVNFTSTGADSSLSITNTQLELGSAATAFEPQNNDYAYVISDSTNRPLALCSNIDGTVADEINLSTGVKFKRFEYLDLDGTLPWAFSVDDVGFKRIQLAQASIPGSKATATFGDGTTVVQKYDGKIVPNADTTAADKQYINGASSLFYITISDTDSGWTDAMTPDSGEMKAYFYGYKMCASDGSAYVSGTKYWKKITDGTGITSTLPTASYTGYTPYKLQYQLATAAEEVVTVEGLINLHSGLNQVEMGEGVIIREKVNPAYTGSTTKSYVINSNQDFPASNFKNRSDKILAIYKNDVRDTKWRILTDSPYPYGKQRADIPEASYDATAVYTVTYTIYTPDKYAHTSNVVDVTASVPSTQKAVLEAVVQQQADNSTAVSVIQNNFARKNQGVWIAPVLLNAWVNFGGSFSTSGYFKDEFGIVHLKGVIKSGTTTANTKLFTLPVGYRPLVDSIFIVSSHNGTADVVGRVHIKANGDAEFLAGANGHLSLDGITFRAEQ